MSSQNPSKDTIKHNDNMTAEELYERQKWTLAQKIDHSLRTTIVYSYFMIFIQSTTKWL